MLTASFPAACELTKTVGTGIAIEGTNTNKIPESKSRAHASQRKRETKKMKTTHIPNLNRRHQSEPEAARPARSFAHVEEHFQASTLNGGCGAPAQFDRSSFYKISNQYFAEEEPRSFAVEAGVFAALIAMALLPIVNSVQAVATLIHTITLV
jgi:hypothetical protein